MKLLISVVSPWEALEASAGGADIIDVKEPSRGSIGAPETSTIKAIKSILPPNAIVSVALGDDPKDKKVLELSSEITHLQLDYVKVGSLGVRGWKDAADAYAEVKSMLVGTKLVAVAYADYNRINNSPSPLELVHAAHKSDCDALMIDTLIKDGTSTFDYLDVEKLMKIKDEANGRGLTFAVAGALNLNHFSYLRVLRPQVVGFRGAACDGDRVRGRVTRDKVKLIAQRLNECSISGLT